MKRSMKSLLGTALVAAALAAPAQAEIGRHTFKVSNGAAEDHPVSAGIKGMSECLADKTDGKMKLRGFYNGELGDDAEATQSVRSGSIEMVVTGAAAIGGIEPAMSAFELPFLFDSDAEVDAVMTGPYYDHVAARMPAHDLVLLSIWENGFRNSTNNKHAITRAEDFAGLNFRVMQNPIFLDTFRRLGANPVPMAFGEVFTALETGAVDGQENPLPLIQASRFYEVQKYLTPDAPRLFADPGADVEEGLGRARPRGTGAGPDLRHRGPGEADRTLARRRRRGPGRAEGARHGSDRADPRGHRPSARPGRPGL